MKRAAALTLSRWLVLVLFAAVGMSAAQAAEKPYPNRQIELIVPYPPGGSLDLVARAINDELGRNFGAPTVVVNKSGGGSSIGTEFAAQAKPDGYTLLMGNNMMLVTVPATQPDLPYKISDFVPISRFGYTPMTFCVRKESPFKTLDELIASAKKNPAKLTCATSGVASIGHFSLELLKADAGVDIQQVPFKGGPPANTATLGGHVDMVSSSLSGVFGLIKSGDLRLLGVAAEKRMPAFPDVPTLAEKGYPNSNMVLWSGLFALKGVDEATLRVIRSVVEKTVTMPAIMEKIRQTGNENEYIPSDKLAQMMGREYAQIVDLIKKANLSFK